MAVTKTVSTSRIHGEHVAEQSSNNTEGNFNDSFQCAQTFKTTTYAVTVLSISLWLEKYFNSGGIIIELQNGGPGSSVLASWSLTESELNSLMPSDVTPYKIDFLVSPLLKLLKNETYSIVARGTGTGYFWAANSLTNDYADGEAWNSNTGWHIDTVVYDFRFLVRTAATWYSYDNGGFGTVVVKSINGSDTLLCDIYTPSGVLQSDVLIMDSGGSVTFTDPPGSRGWFKVTNIGTAQSGDTWAVDLKQEWEEWYYVNGSTGDDTNFGDSPTSAWLTVGKGLSTIVAGQNLDISNDSYNETGITTNNGTSSEHIYVDGNNCNINGVTGGTAIVLGDYVDIENLIVDGCSIGIDLRSSNGQSITNCSFGILEANNIAIGVYGDAVISNCVINNILKIYGGGNSGGIIKLNTIQTIDIDVLAAGRSIYWNRIKNKTVNADQTWWANTGGLTVGNYFYGEEDNDLNNDCYGFVNLNGVDVYNQIVSLGVAYDGCKDSDGNILQASQYPEKLKVGADLVALEGNGLVGTTDYFMSKTDRNLVVVCSEVSITLVGGGGSGAKAKVYSITSGVIDGISIVATGTGYTSAPSVVFATATGGSGASATATVSSGGLSSITIVSGGTGYIAGQSNVLCIFDKMIGNDNKFIIQGNSKITCKVNEWV